MAKEARDCAGHQLGAMEKGGMRLGELDVFASLLFRHWECSLGKDPHEQREEDFDQKSQECGIMVR